MKCLNKKQNIKTTLSKINLLITSNKSKVNLLKTSNKIMLRRAAVRAAEHFRVFCIIKLPAVITSLDSTLYHCHQQGFSPKYRRIVFF